MTACEHPYGTVLTGPNGETYTVGQRGRKPLWVIGNSYKVGEISREIHKKKVANCKIVTTPKNLLKLKFLSSKNIADLKGVSSDFNYLLSTLSASDKGKICETAFKLALFMRISIKNLPKDISLYENNEKVLRINDIGFGTKSGGVDITVVGNNFVGFGTAKMKYIGNTKKTQWNEIEWHKVLGEASMTRKFDDYNKAFIAVVSDKDDIEDKAVPSYIRENFEDNGRLFIYDIEDIIPIWNQILKVCEDNEWDTGRVEESCRDRKVLVHMKHQNNCVDKGVSKTIDAITEGKAINFLIADKPRSGKTISMTSILVKLHNYRKNLK